MGQNGSIVFFTDATDTPPAALIRGAMEIAGAVLALSAWRSIGADREWRVMRPVPFSRKWCRRLKRDWILAARGVVIDDDDDRELAGSNLNASEAAGLYREGASLSLLLGDSVLGSTMWSTLERSVPEDVRGNFKPGDPSIKVGGHDICEDAEHERGFLFGRAVFSFGLFGYGTPNNWGRYRELVFEIPDVVALQRQLEALAGPMKRCVYWSV